ncbi:probable polygalacturonase [Argentina anserina]|uniref:probable polygalacturonase n=1 Tax=Argentina anserina TaxID=57926 RepID=UPI0021768371|nr:probable polygalacturonase [Potentilla anserina]
MKRLVSRQSRVVQPFRVVFSCLQLWLVLVLGFTSALQYHGECENQKALDPRPHSVSLLEFGAVGDGKTLNTVAFQNAVFYVKSFADKGGAQLYVPPGRWLTGSFNLTSHLTLFLETDATILGSQDYTHWGIEKPLPSYGRGIDLPGWRYRSLINGDDLHDVVLTGGNGTIDGQGSVWWEQFSSHSLNYSRPHLVEFTRCDNVVISNLTFLNPPAWNIHPTYCRYVKVQNITLHASPASPYTSGIVPDSSEHVCIENCNISMGHDAISLKSGWDEYGIAYGKSTKNVHIRGVNLQSSLGSGLAFGSEMSGGILNVLVERLQLSNSFIGIALKTTKGRGGYMKDIVISNVEMDNIHTAIQVTGQSGSHPDDKFDPAQLPFIKGITFDNMVGRNITFAGNFSGIYESPFTSICLSNVSFYMTWNSSSSWFCRNVKGFSQQVSPEPCSDLKDSSFNASSSCLFSLYTYNSDTDF